MSEGIYLASEQIKIKSYDLRNTLKALGHDVGLQHCQEALARSFSNMTFIKLLEKEKTDYARPKVAKDGSITGHTFHREDPETQYSLSEINHLVEECKKKNKPLPCFVPPEPRPEEIHLETVRGILTERFEAFKTHYQEDDINTEEFVSSLVDFYPFYSTFSLAEHIATDWDVDDNLLEFLGELGDLYFAAFTRQLADWLERNQIVPPFPVGTKTDQGVIDSIYLAGASCTVKPIDVEETESCGTQVNYEDLVLV